MGLGDQITEASACAPLKQYTTSNQLGGRIGGIRSVGVLGGAQGDPVEKASLLRDAVSDIESHSGYVKSLADGLYSRLTPVLRQEPGCDKTACKEQIRQYTQIPIGCDLASADVVLLQAVGTLNEILRLLEV